VVYTRANHLGVTRCDRNESGEPGPWSVPPQNLFSISVRREAPSRGLFFINKAPEELQRQSAASCARDT